MPSLLEWRHCLLYMWASLKRNSGQSTFHCIYAGLTLNSRIRDWEGKTSWPQVWETSRKETISSGHIIWKRDASRSNSKESTIDSCEIMFSVSGWFNTIEMKMFVSNVTILPNKISPIKCLNQNNILTDKIGGSLPISVETLADHWETVLISTNRCRH